VRCALEPPAKHEERSNRGDGERAEPQKDANQKLTHTGRLRDLAAGTLDGGGTSSHG
jgi:hypothetical protein